MAMMFNALTFLVLLPIAFGLGRFVCGRKSRTLRLCHATVSRANCHAEDYNSMAKKGLLRHIEPGQVVETSVRLEIV